MNKDKIILDLCGGTGAWSKPYRDAGYDVRVCTYPECDVRTFEPPANVYGILAAPPCTQFSVARRTAKTPPDYQGALEIVDACLNIVRQCSLSGTLKFWALENPRGKLRYFLGTPRNTFYQWQFGGQHKKPSDIWGYYNAPKPTVKIEPNIDVDKTWQKPSCPKEYKHLNLNRAAIRAITPAKFARAFYKANQ